MDGVTLLRRAEQVGLRVEAAGDQLKIRGPKAAEPVVRLLAEHKREVLRALANMPEADAWNQRYDALTFRCSIGQRPWSKARRLAWGQLQNEWHSNHGGRSPSWQCAGCKSPIGGAAALDLPDGNRVHFDPIDCLVRFGRLWRGTADEALKSLGMKPPEPDDPADV
jgi:hypothetical protein